MLLGIARMSNILSQRRDGRRTEPWGAGTRVPGTLEGDPLLMRHMWVSRGQHPALKGAMFPCLPALPKNSLVMNRSYQKSPCSL